MSHDGVSDQSIPSKSASSRSAFTSGMSFALIGAFCYGFNTAYARMSAQAGVSGPILIGYRVLLMIVFALIVAIVARQSLKVAKGEWPAVLGMAVASSAVGICYISSVAFIPVTIAAVIFYTFPVLIVLASPFVEGRRLTLPLLCIVGLAFVGVVLVLGPSYSGLDPIGLMLATGASLCAVVQFFVATRSPRTGLNAKIFWMQCVMLPISFGIAALTGGLASPSVLMLAPMAVALTIGGYMLGFVFQIVALSRISATVGGLAFCVEPVVAALSSALVLDERLDAVQYLGGALVIAAIIANVMLESRRNAQAFALKEPAQTVA